MPFLMPISCALVIAALFYVWRDGYRRPVERRNRQLRERVAMLLWKAAEQIPDSA